MTNISRMSKLRRRRTKKGTQIDFRTINADELHAKDMAEPAYRLAYENLAKEFALVDAQIRAGQQMTRNGLKVSRKSETT